MDSWRERRFRAKLSEFLEHFHGHVSKWPVGESLEEIKGVVKGQVSQLSDPQSHAGLLSTAFEIDGETYIEAIAFSNALTDIKDYTSNRDDQRLQLAVMQAKKLIDSLVASNEKALRALEVQPEE
jgi:hypothetical protein